MSLTVFKYFNHVLSSKDYYISNIFMYTHISIHIDVTLMFYMDVLERVRVQIIINE